MGNLDLEQHSPEKEEMKTKKKRSRDKAKILKQLAKREVKEPKAITDEEPKKKLKQVATEDEETEAISDEEPKKKKKKKAKQLEEEGEESGGNGIMTNETFESLGLSDNTHKSIKEMGFARMTQVKRFNLFYY